MVLVVVWTALRSTIQPVKAKSSVMAREVESRIFHSSERREKLAIIFLSRVRPVGRLVVDRGRIVLVPLVLVRRGHIACFRNVDGLQHQRRALLHADRLHQGIQSLLRGAFVEYAQS